MPVENATFIGESLEAMSLTEDERPRKYMEEYLQKKEANGKWIEYWVILRGSYLLFYAHKCEANELRDGFRGSIELTPGSKCTIGKRKKYSFPFFLSTSKARYYFKSPTLLLRHQWIHSMNLSAMGAMPESPPKALPAVPSSQDTYSSQSEDEVCQDENSADESRQALIDESPQTAEDCTEDSSDFPSRLILVRSCSPDSDSVIDFLSGERKPDTSNFTVTNFMNTRNAEIKKSSKLGIDNLSFEEEENVARRRDVAKQQNSGIGSRKNISGSSLGKPMPTFSISPPLIRSNCSGRVVRSAGSIRSLTAESRIPLTPYSDVCLSVRTSSGNLSVTANRFSRHLISSAPDLCASSTA